MKKKTKIIIVDDHRSFRECLASFIEGNGNYEVIASLESGEDLLNYPDLHLADLVLLDVELPGISGIKTAKLINFKFPKLDMICFTMYLDNIYLQQIIEAGFKGFINKASVPEGLFSTISQVLEGRFSFLELTKK